MLPVALAVQFNKHISFSFMFPHDSFVELRSVSGLDEEALYLVVPLTVPHEPLLHVTRALTSKLEY
jgi:hypothetical protein